MSFFEFVKVHFIHICSIISITCIIFHKNMSNTDNDSVSSDASTDKEESINGSNSLTHRCSKSSNEKTWKTTDGTDGTVARCGDTSMACADINDCIHEKVKKIANNMFNENSNLSQYKDMNDFLLICIVFISRTLALIQHIESLLYEQSMTCTIKEMKETIENHYEGYEFELNNFKTIFFETKSDDLKKTFEDSFKDLLYTFKNTLSGYYSLEDFQATKSIYSNMKLTWSLYKFNLSEFRKEKENDYDKMYVLKNTPLLIQDWGILRRLGLKSDNTTNADHLQICDKVEPVAITFGVNEGHPQIENGHINRQIENRFFNPYAQTV